MAISVMLTVLLGALLHAIAVPAAQLHAIESLDKRQSCPSGEGYFPDCGGCCNILGTASCYCILSGVDAGHCGCYEYPPGEVVTTSYVSGSSGAAAAPSTSSSYSYSSNNYYSSSSSLSNTNFNYYTQSSYSYSTSTPSNTPTRTRNGNGNGNQNPPASASSNPQGSSGSGSGATKLVFTGTWAVAFRLLSLSLWALLC